MLNMTLQTCQCVQASGSFLVILDFMGFPDMKFKTDIKSFLKCCPGEYQ